MSKNKQTILTDDPSLAAKTLERGGIVLFPTETVYGIGADSKNHAACLEIYKIKNRPSDNPLIVHVSDSEDIAKIAEYTKEAQILAKHFMPGPLTLVLPKKDPSVFTAGLDTIAVRVPASRTANEMLRSFGGPVSAPSANLSGRPSITRLQDAIFEFDGKVDLILKGEDPTIGLESTVISLHTSSPKILRPGSLEWEELRKYLPNLEMHSAKPGEDAGPLSPGMKYRHYAPQGKVIYSEIANRVDPQGSAIGISIPSGWKYSISLKNNAEYMQKLYSFFRDSDALGITNIYCFPPEDAPGKDALLNRILKAQEG